MSGCAVKFVYNQLDWAIPWYLSDYIALDGDQADHFDARLDQYLSWHRKTQLPLYGEFLNQVADNLDQGMTPETIASVQDRTEALGNVLVERLMPDMVDLFASASDEQLKELFEKFEEDNDGYREDYIDASERAQRKRRAKEVQAYVERWTGGLSAEQEAIIRAGTDQYELMGQEFLDAKLAWQAEFARILELRHDKSVFGPQLNALLTSEGFGQTETFKRKLTHNQDILQSLYLQLERSLSKKQRATAVKKLRTYAKDFYELAEQE